MSENEERRDNQIHRAILSAMDEYTYRLDVRYVRRDEFHSMQNANAERDQSITILQVEMKGIRDQLEKLATIIDQTGWRVVGSFIAVLGFLGVAVFTSLYL